jgi:dihydrofolate synthase / folylpolyglutamate synthase
MNYPESIEYLFALQRIGMRMGTSVTASLLERLANPQRSFPSVLVAGTNGKGSTAAFLSSILKEAGLRVGRYTSPHLERFEERIVVDGSEIPPHSVAKLASAIRKESDAMAAREGGETAPTFFETATAVAFLHFQEEKVDVAVLEVGMGGRLDATSVVDAVACLFTPIDLDHREQLGNTLEEVASEKAGILKARSRALTAPQEPVVMQVLKRSAAVRGANLLESDQIWRPMEGSGNTLTLVSGGDPSRRIEGLSLPLPGRHQWTNAALAAAAAARLPGFQERIDEAILRRGLLETRWPGRCELLPCRPPILLDGAHNPAAARALRSFLIENYTSKGKRVVMVFGAMKDKDLPGTMEPLFSCAGKVIVTRAETPRAADPAVLESLAKRYHGSVVRAPSLSAALSAAREEAGESDLICVTGSLYLVADLKILLGGGEPSSRQAL